MRSTPDLSYLFDDSGLCLAASYEEPAEWVFARESSLLFILRADFEAHGLEGFDFPAIGKSMAQLGLRDASRSFRARGGVAETKQEQMPAGVEDGLKPAHVVNAVRIGKNVKQAGIEYVIETFGPLIEFYGIFDQKLDDEAVDLSTEP